MRALVLVGIELCSAYNPDLQIIEIGHGIRFGPESDPADCEGLVTEIKHLLVIKEDLYPASFCDNAEDMLLSDVGDLIEVLDEVPDALDDPIDANILL